MLPSLTFGFEIVIAILVVLWVLCVRPEYGLFLYGLALGFPDVAIPLGTTINIRLDDGLMLFFLFRSVLWMPAPLAEGQRKVLGWQAVLLSVCFFSAVYKYAGGAPPEAYVTVKMIGCAAIILVLPRLVQSERRLRFLIVGLLCGGMALAIQIVEHLGANSADYSKNFQVYKSAAAFTTWNPNTIGQAAMLVVFAAGLGWIVFPGSRAARIFWPCFAVGFSLIPAMMFVRGTSLSIAAGFVLFLCLSRRWKWVLLFLAVCLALVFYLRTANRILADGAFNVDLTTGEGLSDRYARWGSAIQAIESKPFLGQGFGQEWSYLQNAGSEGRAHDAYLTVWIELGLGGLLLFLATIVQFFRAGWSLYGNPRYRMQGALIVSLIFALVLDSFGLSTLYWEKLPTIALSLAVVVVGLCERMDQEIDAREFHTPSYELFRQHSQFHFAAEKIRSRSQWN
jgi:O-antigen ligase